MTAALVNLANIHYARDRAIEAEALYEKALTIEPSSFEAQYNLGNVLHDSGRFEAAARCYRGALTVDPNYADAHFYLAVTLEKLGRSSDAKPHWVAYRRLAPNGEWVELAREFSE
jgi:tetratricopeptide (TPR) repeat protein